MRQLLNSGVDESLGKAFRAWLENMYDGEGSVEPSNQIVDLLAKMDLKSNPRRRDLGERSYLIKKSQWIIGGDGWAYDIGYGG